jgi:hypothetical protein
MRRLFFGFSGMVIILLTVSCIITTNVFDEEVPLEQSAVLKILDSIVVKNYNGIDVKLRYPPRPFQGFASFTIPAGRTTFVMDLDHIDGGYYSIQTVYRASNIPLSYDFEAGETYRIIFEFTDADMRMTGPRRNIPSIVLVKESDLKTPLLMIQLRQQESTRTVLE